MSNNTMPVTQQPHMLANKFFSPYSIWNMNFHSLNEISHLSLPNDDRPLMDSHTVSIARVYPRTPFACLLPFFDRAKWERKTTIEAALYTDYEMSEQNARWVWMWKNGYWIEELTDGSFYTVANSESIIGTFIECARLIDDELGH